MLREFRTAADVLSTQPDVLAVGPGIGRERDAEIIRLIPEATIPAVIDADAINALAANPEILARCNAPRVLTPHPGEMARLDPDSESRNRRDTAEAFTRRLPCTLLLKGARTIVAENGHPLSYNTTGTPGMAKGGNGDVLTGVIAALFAQGLSSYDAARLGAWLCGRASEMAISHGGETEETLTPSRALDFLGAALRDLRGGCF
jgi:NAD(P)H-hydrate epimerase